MKTLLFDLKNALSIVIYYSRVVVTTLGRVVVYTLGRVVASTLELQ